LGCSPIKVVRELSSNRCETGWFLSSAEDEVRILMTVREDLTQATTGEAVVDNALLRSHVAIG